MDKKKSIKNNGNENKKVTMQDVANLAGVAPSTVSHVINGTATITEDTQKKVNNAISELKYLPNALARALRQNRTNLIGLVISDFSSEFYMRSAASIMKAAQKEGIVVLLSNASFDEKGAIKNVSTLLEHRVDGLIFLGGAINGVCIDHAKKAGAAVVLGDSRLGDLPSVEFDNFNTVKSLVFALHDAGYRRFGYVGTIGDVHESGKTNEIQNLVQRMDGFTKGLNMRNVPESDRTYILDDRLNRFGHASASYNLFFNLVKDKPLEELPQVVVTTTDVIAQGLIGAIQKNGLRVPEDISVIGFDNIDISEFTSPAITTVDQNSIMLGERCFELLIDQLDGVTGVRHELLHQRIIVRDSARIPKEILNHYQ